MDRLLGSNGQYSRFPLPVFLESMQRLGLRRLDFVPQVPHFFCGYRGHADVAPLRAALQGADLRVSVLTPPPYRCSLTAPAGEQRDATIGYYDSCIRLAAELNCHRLVLSAAGACWDIPPQELTEHAAAMLTHLCHTAQVEGVTLLLAPVMGAETPLIAEAPVLNTARQLSQMLAWVDSPALGVCLDTCHIWDGGYDIAGNLEAVLEEFDKTIGLHRLYAVHLNDSMNPLGAHKDRHQKIGHGYIGLEALKAVVRHPVLKQLPFILETPNDDAGYAAEIALLRKAAEESN